LLITSTEFSLARTMTFSSLPLSQAKTISGSRALRCFQQKLFQARACYFPQAKHRHRSPKEADTTRNPHDATRS
jgi:hypothetical protein